MKIYHHHWSRFNKLGSTIELLSKDVFLVAENRGDLGIIDRSSGNPLNEIRSLHSDDIKEIYKIAKNIIVTVANDRCVKVTDPICKISYFTFEDNEECVFAIAIFP